MKGAVLMKLVGNLKTLKSLLQYYGNDVSVAVVISSNLTPIQQDELFNRGYMQYDFPFRVKKGGA